MGWVHVGMVNQDVGQVPQQKTESLPVWRIHSGGYLAEIEAESPEEATRIAFRQRLPSSLAFAISARQIKPKGKVFYMYSVYAYKLVGIDAAQVKKNLVRPILTSSTQNTATAESGALSADGEAQAVVSP